MGRTADAYLNGAAKAVGALFLFCVFMLPFFTYARPFGGQASEVHFCFNRTIYVVLGPPSGGIFVWTQGTHSYEFGPPMHAGQWLLGLSGVPDICLYTVDPIDIRAADAIIMHGRSQ